MGEAIDIPEGYKKTKVGIIPEDWRLEYLQDISLKIMVGIASAATHAYRDQGIILFRNQNIKEGYLDDRDLLFIDEIYEKSHKNKRLKGGDLLTARTGYPGTTCLVPSKYEGAQSFTTLITRPNTDLIDAIFLCYYINSGKGQGFFESNQIGGGQKNVNAASLSRMSIPIPPICEQQQIATILSTWDNAIENTKLIIDNISLRNIGLAQQLLFGEQKLNGNYGKWQESLLGKCARNINIRNKVGHGTEKLHAVTKKEGIIPMREQVKGSSFNNCKIVRQNWFAYNPMRINIGSIALWNSPDEIMVSGDYVVFECDETKLLPRYLEHLRKTNLWDNYMLIAGNGSVRVRIYFKDLAHFKFPLPPVDEQEAILDVLDKANEELQLYEKKLAALQEQKKGLMQKLLTGEIRVKTE